MKRLLLILAILCLMTAGTAAASVLQIPSDTQEIQDEAFMNDTSPEKILLPEGVLRIEARAFAGCGAGDVFLPESMEEIAADAFDQTKVTATVYEGSYAYTWCLDHQIPCRVVNRENARVYHVYDVSSMSWAEAVRFCKSMGGHPATIAMEQECESVYQVMKDEGYQSAYIGLSRKKGATEWKWANGETFGYSNWSEDQPDPQNTAASYGIMTEDGTWQSGAFKEEKRAIVCEWNSGSASEQKTTDQILADFKAIHTRFQDSSGYIPRQREQEAIRAAKEYLISEYASGSILYWSADANGVCFVDREYSEMYCWTPPIEGMMSNGNDVQMSVYSLDAFPDGGTKKVKAGEAAKLVSDNIDYYTLTGGGYTGSRVTPEQITKMGMNQFIVLHTHGSCFTLYDENNISIGKFMVLTTGMKFKESMHEQYHTRIEVGPSLYYSIPEMIHIIDTVDGVEELDHLGITDLYITNNVPPGSLSGSFVYLAVCQSGYPKAGFLKKLIDLGASAVVGFSDDVNRDYDQPFLKCMIEHMLEEKSDGKHYTAYEAFEYAKDDKNVGSEDHVNENSKGAKPIYEGDPNYSLWHGTLAGTVYGLLPSSTKKQPLSGAVITIKSIESDRVDVSTVSDQDGKFEYHLPGGTYQVKVTSDQFDGDGITKEMKIVADETSKFECTFSYELNGQITSEKNEAISEAVVAVQTSKGTVRAQTDQSGKYKMYLYSGKGTITVSADGYRTSEKLSVQIPFRKAVQQNVQLEFLPDVISGYITDSDDTTEALGSVSVQLVNEDGTAVDSGTTTAEGLYMLSAKPGKYTLQAKKTGYEDAKVSVELPFNKNVSRSLTMERKTFKVSGTVTNAEDPNIVVAGAAVTMKNDRESYSATTGTDGKYTVSVKYGDYDVKVIAAGYEPGSGTVSADRDMTADYALKEEEGSVLEGKVFECLSNNFVEGVTVELHRGIRKISYTTEHPNAYYAGEISRTEQDLAEYEETPMETVVTDQNGKFRVHFRFDMEPNYFTDYGEFYGYTLVFRKDGWITRTTTYALRNEEELARRTWNDIGLAPEGTEIRYLATLSSGSVNDTVIHPYSTFSFLFQGNMYSNDYGIRRVELYVNGVRKSSYSAPSYVSSTNWDLGWYDETGYLAIRNKLYYIDKYQYAGGDASWTYAYPQWLNE